MASEQITIRLEQHSNIIDDLKDEAKKRNQPLAALARTFIMDGLARYDAVSEKLLQTDERIEQRLKAIESLVAANLHVVVEQQTRGNRQNAGEADGDYGGRLQTIYRQTVEGAIPKGGRIIAALAES